MNSIISWCNDNSGFMSAVLSLIGLVVSGFAIGVSLYIARIPYRKKLKLSIYEKTFITTFNKNRYKTSDAGIRITCINVGSCDMLLTHLGICASHHKRTEEHHGFAGTQYDIEGEKAEKNIIAPTHIKVAFVDRERLQTCMKSASNKDKIYLYARDSEGKEYYKRIMNYSKFYELYLKD